MAMILLEHPHTSPFGIRTVLAVAFLLSRCIGFPIAAQTVAIKLSS